MLINHSWLLVSANAQYLLTAILRRFNAAPSHLLSRLGTGQSSGLTSND